ncbi:MAG TPA: hypothetical protein VEI06_00620 [Gemmatimonadaceae bacterium]|nr:hypothetical protein [Gemmatimonadaceae bacterium]
MFDKLRDSLRDAMSAASGPARLALMREALVEAKVGLSKIRSAHQETSQQLARERSELEKVQRRGVLAANIGDAETVRVAGQFTQKHQERISVLERKLAALAAELSLAEREVEEMSRQLHAMAAGGGGGGGGGIPAPERPAAAPEASDADFDALRRAAEQAAKQNAAERQLEELKRKMRE